MEGMASARETAVNGLVDGKETWEKLYIQRKKPHADKEYSGE